MDMMVFICQETYRCFCFWNEPEIEDVNKITTQPSQTTQKEKGKEIRINIGPQFEEGEADSFEPLIPKTTEPIPPDLRNRHEFEQPFLGYPPSDGEDDDFVLLSQSRNGTQPNTADKEC